jgi:hypothetical protein
VAGQRQTVPCAGDAAVACRDNAEGRLPHLDELQARYTLGEDDACAWVSHLNDAMISAVAGNDRFATLAGIPLRHPDAAVREIRRARSAGHVGVIIGTAAPGLELDDPRLEPIWAELARTDMPVLLHPTFLALDPRLQVHGLTNAVGRANETTTALSRLLLSPREARAILGGNACELFGLGCRTATNEPDGSRYANW